MDDNNGKSTILKDSDEKHYYYGYSIPRQLSYSSHASSFLGSADSSTTQATDLHLLVAMAEWEESRVLHLTLLRVGVLAALQHRFSFFLAGG